MKLLFGPEVVPAVIALIDDANKGVVLVSPYVKTWMHLEEAVRRAVHSRGVQVLLVVRGGEDAAKQSAAAAPLVSAGAMLKFVDRLHAKLYVGDNRAIITSLNLHESSVNGSWEMAAVIDALSDPDAYKQVGPILKKIGGLARAQESMLQSGATRIEPATGKASKSPKRPAAPKAAPGPSTQRKTTSRRPTAASKSKPKSKSKKKGVCIRCSEALKLNPQRPFCAECYKSWSKWENPEYEEKFCHGCGNNTATSFAKPLCRPCFKASA